MANFPLSVTTFVSRNAGDTIQPAHVNDLQDEINAIEAGYLNGTARLNSSRSTLAALSVVGGSTLAALTVNGFQSSTLSSGNTNDLVVTANIGVLSIIPAAGGSTLTGISLTGGAPSGRQLTIFNNSATAFVLAQSTGSISSNQFGTPRFAGSTLGGGCSVDLFYNGSGWFVKGL